LDIIQSGPQIIGNRIMIKAIILLIAVLLTLGCNLGRDDSMPQEGRIVKIETDKGIIKFALYEKDAPITTKNFISLVNQEFYDGLTFHRVEPGFVVQGGDPNGDGTGGSDDMIPLEVKPSLKHVKGAVGMARSQAPNSASSQFYITLDAVHDLDGNYAVFGIVKEGFDVAQKIRVGDVMNKVTIE